MSTDDLAKKAVALASDETRWKEPGGREEPVWCHTPGHPREPHAVPASGCLDARFIGAEPVRVEAPGHDAAIFQQWLRMFRDSAGSAAVREEVRGEVVGGE